MLFGVTLGGTGWLLLIPSHDMASNRTTIDLNLSGIQSWGCLLFIANNYYLSYMRKTVTVKLFKLDEKKRFNCKDPESIRIALTYIILKT